MSLSKLHGKFHTQHALLPYTSWKIGGPAEFFYQPANLSDLIVLLQTWQKEPITVLGAGCNVLVRDGGVDGLVIYLRNCLNELQQLDAITLRVEAGVSLARLVQHCTHVGVIDAAYFIGVPGTVGGALAMNAGAYNKFIWDYIVAVETINRRGEVKLRLPQEFSVGYRQVFGLAPDEWFVAGHIMLSAGDPQAAEQLAQELMQKRQASQPLDFPSCGSVFRNPAGDYAARLIEKCNLKGKQIGGAKISEKHANFIINVNSARASEVEALMAEIVAAVEKTHGITLVPEVKVIGKK